MRTVILLFFCALFSPVANAQEMNAVYTNNFYSPEVLKIRKIKLDDLKYEEKGSSLHLKHQSKGIDAYATQYVMPRPTVSHWMRDFEISYDLRFEESASDEDQFGMSFMLYPLIGVDQRDSITLVSFTVSASGRFSSFVSAFLKNPNVCYTCPGVIKDKSFKTLYEQLAPQPIPDFKTGKTNTVTLTRKDDTWTWQINGQQVLQVNNVAMHAFDNNQSPYFLAKGKTAFVLENFKENYSHTNVRMNAYLAKFPKGGIATVSSQCLKNALPVAYEVTTNRGMPSVQLSWPGQQAGKIVHEYFDFEETASGAFRHSGLSTRDFAFLNQYGTAQKISVNPAEGRVQLELHLAGTYSSYQSGSSSVMTHSYCPLFFSLKK